MLKATIRLLITRLPSPDDPGETARFTAQQIGVVCSEDELVVNAVRRADVDPAGSALWRAFLDGSLVDLWVVDADFIHQLEPWSTGECIISDDLTVGDLLAYFGDLPTSDPASLAVAPVEGIGGGPIFEWVELTRTISDLVHERRLLDIIRYAFEAYGAAYAVKEARFGVRRWLARRVRRDARLWQHERTVTRRLARFVDRHSSWDSARFAALLDLDQIAAGDLLRSRGFTLSRPSLRKWVWEER